MSVMMFSFAYLFHSRPFRRIYFISVKRIGRWKWKKPLSGIAMFTIVALFCVVLFDVFIAN